MIYLEHTDVILGFLSICHTENVASRRLARRAGEGGASGGGRKEDWCTLHTCTVFYDPAPTLYSCVCKIDGRPWLTPVAATLLKAVLSVREERRGGGVSDLCGRNKADDFSPQEQGRRGRRKMKGDGEERTVIKKTAQIISLGWKLLMWWKCTFGRIRAEDPDSVTFLPPPTTPSWRHPWSVPLHPKVAPLFLFIESISFCFPTPVSPARTAIGLI